MSKRTQLALRREVARTFRAAIVSRRLSITSAARELGVSRQSMYKYLRGSVTPRADVVSKACSKWNLTMTVDGLAFSASEFGPSKGPRIISPVQMNFSDMLRSLRDRDLDVQIIRTANEFLELKVRIKFAS